MASMAHSRDEGAVCCCHEKGGAAPCWRQGEQGAGGSEAVAGSASACCGCSDTFELMHH